MKKLTITVGIPAYNEEANIKLLLTSILKQKEKKFRLEKIIVYSDASTDNTVQEIENLKNTFIRVINGQTRQGQAKAQNQIIKNTNSDILILLNADIGISDENFITKLITPIVEEKSDLVSARIEELKPITLVEKILDASMKFKKYIYEKYNNGDNVYTCFGRVRAFSNKFYKNFSFKSSIGEDAYSYLYCKFHGYKYSYTAKARIWYRLPETFSDHEKQSIRFYKSQQTFEEKFGEDFVNKCYYLSPNLSIISFFKTVFSRPLIILYLFIAGFLKFKSKFTKRLHEMWEPSKSSKKLVKFRI